MRNTFDETAFLQLLYLWLWGDPQSPHQSIPKEISVYFHRKYLYNLRMKYFHGWEKLRPAIQVDLSIDIFLSLVCQSTAHVRMQNSLYIFELCYGFLICF